MKHQTFYSVGLIKQMLLVGSTAPSQSGSSLATIVGVVVAIVVVAAIIVVVVVVIIFIRRRRRLVNTREIKLFLVSNGVMMTLIYYRRQVSDSYV